MTWVERKLIGRFQVRYGPNRVGPYGLLQPIADLGKMARKEHVIPDGARPRLYLLGAVRLAVLRHRGLRADPVRRRGDGARARTSTSTSTWPTQRRDPATSRRSGSLGFYGLLVGGWASGSKYSLLGGMRAIAQLVSYEVAFTLAVIGVIIHAQSLSFTDIVHGAGASGSGTSCPQFLGFLVFAVAAVAESNRPPFDLPRPTARSSPATTRSTAACASRCSPNAEFVNAITLSALGVGAVPGRPRRARGCPGPIWMLLKTGLFLFLFIWLRATVPRVRFDQLMSVGWKVLLPVATLNLIVTAAFVAFD